MGFRHERRRGAYATGGRPGRARDGSRRLRPVRRLCSRRDPHPAGPPVRGGENAGRCDCRPGQRRQPRCGGRRRRARRDHHQLWRRGRRPGRDPDPGGGGGCALRGAGRRERRRADRHHLQCSTPVLRGPDHAQPGWPALEARQGSDRNQHVRGHPGRGRQRRWPRRHRGRQRVLRAPGRHPGLAGHRPGDVGGGPCPDRHRHLYGCGRCRFQRGRPAGYRRSGLGHARCPASLVGEPRGWLDGAGAGQPGEFLRSACRGHQRRRAAGPDRRHLQNGCAAVCRRRPGRFHGRIHFKKRFYGRRCCRCRRQPGAGGPARGGQFLAGAAGGCGR